MSCARWRRNSSGPRCCSRAGRIPFACCVWRKKRSGPRSSPCRLLNVDTGHHFPELNEFRDRRAEGTWRETHHPQGGGWPSPRASRCRRRGTVSRNSLQIPDPACRRWKNFVSTACIGGARRDEEKARAKERFFSFRDSFGQWDPKNQRPGNLEPVQRDGSIPARTCACSR